MIVHRSSDAVMSSKELYQTVTGPTGPFRVLLMGFRCRYALGPRAKAGPLRNQRLGRLLR